MGSMLSPHFHPPSTFTVDFLEEKSLMLRLAAREREPPDIFTVLADRAIG